MMYNILMLILATATDCLATSLSDRERLVNALLRDDVAFTSVRPDGDSNHIVTVNISISLNRIQSFDTSTGNIELLIWKTLRWTDNRLMWDKEQFGGIDHIQLPRSKIWTPDIVLYTGTEMTLPPEKSVVANSDSTVFYVPATVAQVPCIPHDSSGDKWSCTLKYGSWVYNGQELDMQLLYDQVDTLSFWHEDWELTFNSAQRNSMQFDCCPETYIDVTFTFTLTRRTKH